LCITWNTLQLSSFDFLNTNALALFIIPIPEAGRVGQLQISTRWVLKKRNKEGNYYEPWGMPKYIKEALVLYVGTQSIVALVLVNLLTHLTIHSGIVLSL
jgi:hypothetical protein